MTVPDSDPRDLVRQARALLRSGGDDHPHRRGVQQAERGEYSAAIASFREAIAAVPDAPWSYVALADVLVETGSLDEAADALSRALERTPANASALRESIAVGLIRTGALDAAVDAFRALLAQEPDRSAAAVGLARALFAQADALRLEAAQLLIETPDLGDSEQLLEAAIEAAPRLPGLYRRLAESLAARGDHTRAITVIQVGLIHDPDDADALALLAELLATDAGSDELLSAERAESLLQLVERAVSLRPDDRDVLVRRAQLLTRFAAPLRAAEAWKAVITVEPEVAVWHRELGDRLAEAGDFEAAGVAYDRAVALGYQVY
jgi:predicted Zn-dependent protease